MLITLITFKAVPEDYWLAGTLVFAIVVLIANLKVAQKLNNHTWVSTAFLVASVLSFWFMFWIESFSAGVPTMYWLFEQFKTQGILYLVMLWCCWMTYS